MARKIKGKIKAIVKKKPIKAGRIMPKGVGGILNAKVVATAKEKQNG